MSRILRRVARKMWAATFIIRHHFHRQQNRVFAKNTYFGPFWAILALFRPPRRYRKKENRDISRAIDQEMLASVGNVHNFLRSIRYGMGGRGDRGPCNLSAASGPRWAVGWPTTPGTWKGTPSKRLSAINVFGFSRKICRPELADGEKNSAPNVAFRIWKPQTLKNFCDF